MSSSNNGMAKEFASKRKKALLSCDRCKPHRGENRERVARRSWKHRSRKSRQHE